MSYSNPLYQKIYFASPLIVKNLMSSLYGLIESRKRYGNHFHYWFELLKNYEYKSNSDLINFRDSQLESFLKFVLENCGFYKDINSLDIKNFPTLNKQDLRKNFEKILVKNSEEKTRIVHTSGTTGSSLIFPLTYSCFQREYAFRAMHYWWAGIDVTKKPKIATFSGHPVTKPDRTIAPFWVYDYFNNWLLFSSYHIKPENEKYYIQEFLKFEPEVIHGYPSTVYLIARAYRKYGSKLNSLKAIFTASETLLDFQRKEIEEAFQVKVYNWYGNTEMCANVVECEKSKMHLKYEHSFVEILNDKNEECKPGETGRLICTNFSNKAFPIIRYDIGDIVKVSEKQECDCGRGGIIVDFVQGRIEDYVITKDNKKIGRLDHLFKDTIGIKEAQIVQNEIGKIIINYVKDSSFSKKDLELLKKECELRFSDQMDIELNEISSLERTKNGKIRFIVSNVSNDLNKANK